MNTVYLIENTKNDKLYIGVTNKSLEKRLKEHISKAKRNHKRHLQNAIRKHGSNAFQIHPLEKFENRDKAYEAEKKWIKLFNTYEGEHGYNMTGGGEGAGVGKKHPMFGKSRIFSEEHKRKLKNKNIAKKHKRKISKANRFC